MEFSNDKAAQSSDYLTPKQTTEESRKKVINIEFDFSSMAQGVELVNNFIAGMPGETKTLHVTLSPEELIQWDAHGEKVRETFRHSLRKLGQEAAEARRLFVLFESEDETILSVGKFDNAGKWQFIDLEGNMRIPGMGK